MFAIAAFCWLVVLVLVAVGLLLSVAFVCGLLVNLFAYGFDCWFRGG